jgi:hypothetical protein
MNIRNVVATAALWTAFCSAAMGQTHRIVVIDISGSMHGKKTEALKRELRDQIDQRPPSIGSPLHFILFDFSPRGPFRFETGKAAKQFLGSLPAGGGTAPHVGLSSAVELIKSLGDVPIALVWVGDQDMGSPRQMKPVLKELNTLLTNRGSRGLEQTVQLHSWGGGTNQLLINELKKIKSVNLKPRGAPLSLAEIGVTKQIAKVDILSVAKDKPGFVSVTFSAELNRQCSTGNCKVVPYRIRLQRPVSSAAKSWQLTSGHRANGQATVKLSDSELKSGSLELTVMFSPFTSGGAPDKATTSATLPWYPIPFQLAAKTELDGDPSWNACDPSRVDFAVNVKFGVRCQDSWFPKKTPLDLGFVAESDVNWGSQPKSHQLSAPGTAQRKIKLSIDEPKTPSSPIVLASLSLKNSPDYLVCSPDRVDLGLEKYPLPPPRQATVEFKVVEVSPPIWYDLPDVAHLKAKVEVNVVGQLPNQYIITTVAPSKVQEIRLTPNTLKEGKQFCELDLLASMLPAPEVTSFEFGIELPPDNGRVIVTAPDTVSFDAVGPAPIKLKSLCSSRPITFLRPPREVELPILIGIEGHIGRKLHDNLRYRIFEKTGNDALSGPQKLREPTVVQSHSAAPRGEFFRDVEYQVSVLAQPDSLTPAVEPTRINRTICYWAPFKLYLTGSLLGLLALSLPCIYFFVSGSCKPQLRVEEDGEDQLSESLIS